MNILAIETSTHEGSCALSLGGVVVERRLASDRPSSETLLPAVQQLLAEAGVALSQLDGIVFGAGPGAFTGIRVAVGVTQGLAFVHDLPVLGVETLAALAFDAHAEIAATLDPAARAATSAEPLFVLAALDARMSEIYAAAYRVSAEAVERMGEIEVAGALQIALPETNARWVLCGNAADASEVFSGRVRGMRRAATAGLPRAAAVAVLGERGLARGEGGPAASATPLYVRDKVALTVAERLAKGGRA